MSAENGQDCFICRKHRGELQVPGGAIYEDDLFFAAHASIPETESDTYLGTILLEPKRHTPGLAELSDQGAQSVGHLITQLGRAIKRSEGAEHIYLFVFGHHVDHLHIWLVPRYPGTPREYWGTGVDEWPEAPRGDSEAVAELSQRLREQLVLET